MFLTRENTVKILEVMDKFPEAERFQLKQDSSSGIGSTLSLIVYTQVNGYEGEFIVEISGVEDW